MNEILVDRDTWNKLLELGYVPKEKNRIELPELGMVAVTSEFIPEPTIRRHEHGRPNFRPRR